MITDGHGQTKPTMFSETNVLYTGGTGTVRKDGVQFSIKSYDRTMVVHGNVVQCAYSRRDKRR